MPNSIVSWYDTDLEFDRLRDYNHFIKIFGLEDDSEVDDAYHKQLANHINYLYIHHIFDKRNNTYSDEYKNFLIEMNKNSGSGNELVDFKCLGVAVDCWHDNTIQWIDNRNEMDWKKIYHCAIEEKAQGMEEVYHNMFQPIFLVLKEKITDIRAEGQSENKLNHCEEEYGKIEGKVVKYKKEIDHRIVEMKALSSAHGAVESNQLFFLEKFLEEISLLMNDMVQNIDYVISIKKSVIPKKEITQ